MSPGYGSRHLPGIPDRPAPETAQATESTAAPAATPEPRPALKPVTAQAPALEAVNLVIGWRQGSWFRGERDRALSSNISLALPAGRLVALVGPNGSGKSTLLRTLCGLQPRLGGAILLSGDDIETLEIEERARRVACVFNEPLDSGYYRVFDFVAFGRYPYTGKGHRLTKNDELHVRGAVAAVGMEAFAERSCASLSDGERQKVNIARALAQDTQALVLDEPTAFLDAPSRIEIFHLAGKLAHEGGKAVVVCTHEVDLALRTADEIWVMDRNHRFEAGNPMVISHSGAIGRAFETPGVRFDPITGGFRVESPGRHGQAPGLPPSSPPPQR